MNILSEKDLNSVEFDFLVRKSTLDFQHECPSSSSSSTSLSSEDLNQQENKEDGKLVSSLKIKIPELKVEEDDDDDDGFKTPTSPDHQIQVILKCPPPAPRKPKSIPSNKRKAISHRRVFLDLSSEIQSLFPPSFLADLGGKIRKKVRQ